MSLAQVLRSKCLLALVPVPKNVLVWSQSLGYELEQVVQDYIRFVEAVRVPLEHSNFAFTVELDDERLVRPTGGSW